MLTQQLLKDCVDYDPQTGIFTYKKTGKIAGFKHKEGYTALKIYGKQYVAHRLAFLFMTGILTKRRITHKNKIKNDNRWSNLKEVNLLKIKSLTQDFLKSRLFYDENTGIFTYTKTVSTNAILGEVAGFLHKSGYWKIKICNKSYLLHRLAYLWMTGKLPKNQIDHINGITHDNSWTNLRDATNLINSQNRKKRIDNTSGIVGIHWNIRSKKWVATITTNKKTISLGYFLDINDAISARKQAEKEFGFHPNHGR